MKITKATPLLLDRFCFVRIETDEGITGLGESGTRNTRPARRNWTAAPHRWATRVTCLAEQEVGFIAIPAAPGIGVELVPDAERRFPMHPRPIRMRSHADGSVVDM